MITAFGTANHTIGVGIVGVERTDPDIFIPVVGFGIREVNQCAELTNTGFPSITGQHADIGIDFFRCGLVNASRRHHDFGVVKIERAVGFDIDITGNAAFELIGGTGFIHINTVKQACRDICKRHRTAGRGKNLATINGSGYVAQTANSHAVYFTAAAAGDLYAGDTLQCFNDVVIGKFADVFCNDGIDDLNFIALDIKCFG